MRCNVGILALMLLAWLPAEAQFYTVGDDRGSLKWNEMQTSNYRVIYPRGLDSLARSYAVSLEKWHPAVSATGAFLPNQSYSRKMPVILHAETAIPNGVVTWAPRRVDLLCLPDPYSPIPLKWEDQLLSHELRHVAQMQFGRAGSHRIPGYILGEMWAGALAGVYPGTAFLEGDAVISETELSASGRGRTANFLEYYRACLAAGDKRDFWKWTWGSLNKYTPDHYRSGYIMMSAPRYLYDCPQFTDLYFGRIRKHFLPFWNFDKSMMEASGGRANRKTAFSEMCDTLQAQWAADEARRAPFDSSRQVTDSRRLFTEYTSGAAIGQNVFCVRTALDKAAELVRIDSTGHVERIGAFASQTSRLSSAAGRIWWSEYTPDVRWSLKSSSRIRWRDADGVHDLTKHGRLFNPAPNSDGTLVCAVEYPVSGGSALLTLDAADGRIIGRTVAPDGMQFVEAAWLEEGKLAVLAITEDGSGIYEVSETFPALLPASPVTVKNLLVDGGQLYFISDKNGVDELYRLAESGAVEQVTNTRFGIGGPAFSSDGKLWYTVLSPDGRNYCVGSIPDGKKVEWEERSAWPVADKLSAQADTISVPDVQKKIWAPEKYSKFRHLLKFHSWAPVFVNPDAVASLSAESLQTAAGAGVTAFFQNELGTMHGSVGYNIWNPWQGLRNCLHGSFTYSGWYPVIEASFDVGKYNAASVIAYLPLNFSRGGWSAGLVPQARATFAQGSRPVWWAAVRGYAVRPVAPSGIYPKAGFGAEVLAGTASSHVKAYAYIPGFYGTHGFKLSGIAQKLPDHNVAQVSLMYALPFAALDWSFMCPVTYVRNLELYPKVAQTWMWNGEKSLSYLSVGADFDVVLSFLACIPYTTRIGVGYEFCPALEKKHYVNLIFSIDL